MYFLGFALGVMHGVLGMYIYAIHKRRQIIKQRIQDRERSPESVIRVRLNELD